MRIQNDGIAASGTSSASPVGSVAQPGASVTPASTSNTGVDQVDISSLSGNIAAAAADLAERQAARVSHLTAVYASGAYQADSMQISRAMVSNAIAGGSLEEDC